MKFLFLFALISLSPFANASPNCQEMETPFPNQKGGLCIYPGSPNGDLLYYLHGRGGHAGLWEEAGFWPEQIRAYWQAHGMPAPTVVAVSLGEEWLLGPKTTAPAGFGALEFFTGRVMPAIESQIGGVKRRRILLGDSMGGFNSLQLGLKTDLFAKVAALCAPMGADLSPFDSDEAIHEYLRKSSVFRSGKYSLDKLKAIFAGMVKSVRYFWSSKEEFEGSDPVPLARRLKAPLSTKFYLAVGYFDRFTAYEGNEALAAALKASGTSVDWRPQWGDHCAVDIPSLSEFLVR